LTAGYGDNAVYAQFIDVCEHISEIAWDTIYLCMDQDGDSICDFSDNCPYVWNQGQVQCDGDGSGDACDNCPCNDNYDQSDIDQDGWGDVCDPCPWDPWNSCGWGPYLSIPWNIPASVNSFVQVPIFFTSNGHAISTVLFSVDYDHDCLSFDPSDYNGDGIPDSITPNFPGWFNGSVTFNWNDHDGELDFTIADFSPPLDALPDGLIGTITFGATCQPPFGTTLIAPVNFSVDPMASYGNTGGQSVSGTTYNGSVEIWSVQRGDCNSDGRVDAGDISALVLEIFDGDGMLASDAPYGSFYGNPLGCDANADGRIDAGDIPCTVLIYFEGPGACGMPFLFGGMAEMEPALPSLIIPEQARITSKGTVTFPVNFTANGNSISATVFSVDYDNSLLSFDPTDRNGDGIPDAVTLNVPNGFNGSASFDQSDADGELDFVIADFSSPLGSLPDGQIALITFNTVRQAKQLRAGAVKLSQDPIASFGTTDGTSVSGSVNNVVHDLELRQISVPKKVRSCGGDKAIQVTVVNKGTQAEVGDIVLKKNGMPVYTWVDQNFALSNDGITNVSYSYNFADDAGSTIVWTAEVVVLNDQVFANNTANAATTVSACK
jgi:hypothetical protein